MEANIAKPLATYHHSDDATKPFLNIVDKANMQVSGACNRLQQQRCM